MSLRDQIAGGLARLTAAIVALNTKVDSGTPVETMVTPVAGDILIVKRGSAFYLGLVDSLLGGGGGAASLPIDVVAPAAGQEVYGVVDGVPKRIPIAQLINDAYPQPLGLWDYWTDWRAASGNANAPGAFAGAAISSGTNTTALPTGGMAGYNDHGVFLRSSTTADGGYRYQTTSLVGMYFGGVARKFRGQFLWRTSFTGRTVRLGFHDSNTVADAVDGAYFEISGATCSAKTANNSTRTTHATTITLSLDVAYTFDIEVNAAASEARYRVWGGNDYDTALMDVTISTNIPNTSARAFGAGIVATEVSTTASDIGILYSLGIGTPAGFARVYGVYSTPVVRPSAFASGDWTATAVAGGIELNITAMPASGSAAVTALRYRLDGGAPVPLSGTGTGVRTITGLTPGQAYAVQIQQVTAAGESPWSDTKSRTPTAPAVPVAFTAGQWTATAGVSSIVVNITALPVDGGSTITALQYRLDGGTPVAFAGTGTGSRTITGLTPSTEYDVEIRAVNAVGNGAWSDLKSATPTAGGGGGALTVTDVTIGEIFGGAGGASLTIPAVASGNSLIVVTRNADAATTVTGGAEVGAGVTLSGEHVHFFKIENITDGRTAVQVNAPGGDTSTAVAVLEVDDNAIATASTVAAGTGSGTTINQAFTTTAANATAVGMAYFSNGVTQTAGSGWSVAPGTSSYDAVNYIADAGAAGAKTTDMTLADSRSWGMVVQAFVRA